MPILVHHRPIDATRTYKLHAWSTTGPSFIRDVPANAGTFDFTLAGVTEARDLAMQYHSGSAGDDWEDSHFIRFLHRDVAEIWTFEQTARLVFSAPGAPTTASQITVNAITQKQFVGGFIYAWDPYNGSVNETFPQTSRNDGSATSTFVLPVRPWMAGGFHLKLVSADKSAWEDDSANRIWVPSDGSDVWLKSGQVDLRNSPLTLTAVSFAVMVPKSFPSTPVFQLEDPVEQFFQTLNATATAPAADPLFNVFTYTANIFPFAAYRIGVIDKNQGESNPTDRPFPIDEDDPTVVGVLLLGCYDWFDAQPKTHPVTLQLEPEPNGVFVAMPTLAISIGIGPVYQQPAIAASGSNWQSTANVFAGVGHLVAWNGSGVEKRSDPFIDSQRWLTPDAASPIYYSSEGVYGFTTSGPVLVADLTNAQRQAVMADAFGAAVVPAAGFNANELPHGATFSGGKVYFVLFAPHAARVGLVLLNTVVNRRMAATPMSITADRRYWWCSLPAASAPHGTQYRFALNETIEILDPASRGIVDSGNFNTTPADDPTNPDTSWSWSRVIDPAQIHPIAINAVNPWKTMGWASLLICELHPYRFTDRNVSGGTNPQILPRFDQIAAESAPGGYLNKLGVTAIELLPIHEFLSTNSWGYNPAFYFAPESSYGGPEGLARCVRACHDNGLAVLLDVVYNHTNDTPLNTIAPEVFINGSAYGGLLPKFDCAMVKEFLRQAHVYIYTAFGLDGFRFDDTKTMVEGDGWDLLTKITGAVRGAAVALGQPWPYQVAENDPKAWDITNPATLGMMDGQWQINQVYNLGAAAYDPWPDKGDDGGSVATEMRLPETLLRPFYQAVRAAETHDSVGHPGDGEVRIAARPPFGQGLQMAKAMLAATLLSNGIPMFFMGAEYGEVRSFSMDNSGDILNPYTFDVPNTDNGRVLAWCRSLIGLRKNQSNGLNGDDNQTVTTGARTVAFTRGWNQQIWVCFTFGTSNKHPTAGSLGLPDGGYKEIFNSSWPDFQVAFEEEQTNGSTAAQIYPGTTLNLPYVGAVVFERI